MHHRSAILCDVEFVHLGSWRITLRFKYALRPVDVIDGWAQDIANTFTKKFGKINKLTVTMTKFECSDMCMIMRGQADIIFTTGPCPANAAACSVPGSGFITTVATSYAKGNSMPGGWYKDTPVHEFAHAIGFYHDRNNTNSIRSYNHSAPRYLTEKDFQIMSQFYFSGGY